MTMHPDEVAGRLIFVALPDALDAVDPCHHCGERYLLRLCRDLAHDQADVIRVGCVICLARGPACAEADEALTAWNTRQVAEAGRTRLPNEWWQHHGRGVIR